MTNGDRSQESEIAVYLGLGSNIGDRETHLHEAIERIKALGLEIKRESSLYETEPVAFADQPWFLNQVIEVKVRRGLTSGDGTSSADAATIGRIQAEALLSELLNIEREMGRERTIANGPRVIDIDLLLFGEMIIEHSKEEEEQSLGEGIDVFVPHPRMHLRRFVLEPLCEIAPEIVHPVLKKSCRKILAGLSHSSSVTLLQKGKLPRFIHRT